jgi:hypothetical protein
MVHYIIKEYTRYGYKQQFIYINHNIPVIKDQNYIAANYYLIIFFLIHYNYEFIIFFHVFICKLSICLLSIFSAFLPNSKTKPKVSMKKKIIIITRPYIPFVYALTT